MGGFTWGGGGWGVGGGGWRGVHTSPSLTKKVSISKSNSGFGRAFFKQNNKIWLLGARQFYIKFSTFSNWVA
jgi:hypothetical protein